MRRDRESKRTVLNVLKQISKSFHTSFVITDPSLPDNPIIFANQCFEELTGYERNEYLYQNCRLLQGRKTNSRVRAQIKQAIAEQHSGIFEVLNYKKDGSVFWNELFINPILNDQGHPLYIIAIQHDITKRKQTEMMVEVQNKVLREIEAGMSLKEGLICIKEVANLFLHDCGECIIAVEDDHTPLSLTTVGEDEAGLEPLLSSQNPQNVILNTIRSVSSLISVMFHFDSSYMPTDADHAFLELLSSGVKNAVEKSQKQQSIQQLVYYDQLTGLPNLDYFKKIGSELIGEAKERNTKIFVLLLDVDHFKLINDHFGHEMGDFILKELTKRLQQCTAGHYELARFGGDEFVMVGEFESEAHVLELLQCIFRETESPFLLDEKEYYGSSSVGVSVFPMDGGEIGELLKNADIAMYMAKRKDNEKYAFFQRQHGVIAAENFSLVRDLHNAIINQEFVVYYQPKVNMITRKIIGFEALVRWIHPEKGIISPDRFIPLAERHGKIIEIEHLVLEQVCRDQKAWLDRGYDLRKIAVNISATQFFRSNFLEVFQSILQRSGIKASWLELEVTERIAMTDIQKLIPILKELQTMGVSLYIDDFGTGYSSLRYLQQLPLSGLKIDRSFISDINSNSGNLSIVRSIIQLAVNLGLTIVAEGVETTEEQHVLIQCGCIEAQGYYYGKPISAAEIDNLLKT
ncbi:putative bifunctional diguanylate cyclase/phosphodiesterase [Priestia koreensis]|uniref:putative bifunctional diguanylate cyclase/phosphodiesterase n=1 Tax=Priestia koreensis TaxID=284581 RepID=UPI0006A9FF36|nr:bifunctional diguanylate cyclase/phosphodiesterase [Priestia koreensis]